MVAHYVMGWSHRHLSDAVIVRCKFQKRGSVKAIEAFCVKSRYPVFLTLFEGAESENDGYQAEFLVFNVLIAIFG